MHWLDENKLEIPALFNIVGFADIKTAIFETNLKNKGYVAENAQALVDSLSVKGSPSIISLKKLQEFRDLASGVHKTVVGAKVTDSKQAQKKAAVFEP